MTKDSIVEINLERLHYLLRLYNLSAPARGQVPGMQMVDANASAFFVTPTGFNNVA